MSSRYETVLIFGRMYMYIHANILWSNRVTFTKYRSTPKSYYKSPLGNRNSASLQSYFLSAILHQVQLNTAITTLSEATNTAITQLSDSTNTAT